jgi:hypothetical protein
VPITTNVVSLNSVPITTNVVSLNSVLIGTKFKLTTLVVIGTEFKLTTLVVIGTEFKLTTLVVIHSSHCHRLFGSCIKNVFGFHSRKLFVLSKADSFFKRDRDVIVDESTTTYVMLSPLTL